MTEPATAWATIKSSERRHWGDTGLWVVFTVVGGLIPLWATYVLLRLFSVRVDWFEFSRHGQFAIYSASLITAAVFLVERELWQTFPRRRCFVLFLIVGLIVSALLFAGVTAAKTPPADKRTIILDEVFLANTSIGLYIVSLALGTWAVFVNNVRTQLDLKATEERKISQLGKDFDALGGKQ